MLREMWLVHRPGERAKQVRDHEVLLWTVTHARKGASGKAKRDQTQGARPREHDPRSTTAKLNLSRTGSSQNRMASQVSV